ncbi:RNA polymerase sigma factor [Glutamicibacter creatinolyticus]|uniref:RNA polymerase sigma factor n=1 Tax=Glutamicibacter creatinolyticus TaxID=162496 RepID=UPI0037C0E97D
MAIDSELGTSGASDAQLIEGLRFGSGEHQELLYRRHRQVALAVAYRHTDNPSEAEDIVSESFLRVFSLIRRGQGPTEFFRAYLLTAVSREAFARNRAASRQLPTDDLSQFEDGQDNADEVMQRAESKSLRSALSRCCPNAGRRCCGTPRSMSWPHARSPRSWA